MKLYNCPNKEMNMNGKHNYFRQNLAYNHWVENLKLKQNTFYNKHQNRFEISMNSDYFLM